MSSPAAPNEATAELDVSVSQTFAGGPTPVRGYVANFTQLLDPNQPGPAHRRTFTLPVGGAPRSIRLHPGRYWVEMFLPSGEVRSAEVSVQPGSNPPLALDGEPAQEAWLGWQAASGNLEASAAPTPARAQRRINAVTRLATVIGLGLAVIAVGIVVVGFTLSGRAARAPPSSKVAYASSADERSDTASMAAPTATPPSPSAFPRTEAKPRPPATPIEAPMAPADRELASVGQRRPGSAAESPGAVPYPEAMPEARAPVEAPMAGPADRELASAGQARPPYGRPAESPAASRQRRRRPHAPFAFQFAKFVVVATAVAAGVIALVLLVIRIAQKLFFGRPFVDPIYATRARRARLAAPDSLLDFASAPRIAFWPAFLEGRTARRIVAVMGSGFLAGEVLAGSWTEGIGVLPSAWGWAAGGAGAIWLTLLIFTAPQRARSAPQGSLQRWARSASEKTAAASAADARVQQSSPRTAKPASFPTLPAPPFARPSRSTYLLSPSEALPPRGAWDIVSSMTSGFGLNGALATAGVEKLGLKVELLRADASDDAYETFHISGAQQPSSALVSFVLSTFGERSAELMTAPLPWQTQQGPAVIDVLAPKAAGGRLSVAIQDPDAGILLGYLSSGGLSEAIVIARDLAEHMLEDKLVNPFGAAAAGYVLIADPARDVQAADPREERWRSWIDNLNSWYPHLPDGAVLEGWRLLQRKNDGDLELARKSFLDAFDRGIPVFTEGLRRLSMGLALFAVDKDGAPDQDVRFALATVETASVRANPSQCLTTLRLGE